MRAGTKNESPYWKWFHRMQALRCRKAVFYTWGNQAEAAKLLGMDRSTLYRILQRDNKRIDEEGN